MNDNTVDLLALDEEQLYEHYQKICDKHGLSYTALDALYKQDALAACGLTGCLHAEEVFEALRTWASLNFYKILHIFAGVSSTLRESARLAEREAITTWLKAKSEEYAEQFGPNEALVISRVRGGIERGAHHEQRDEGSDSPPDRALISALDAAKFLLTLENESEGDLMSNFKLQKLLYYAQGVHLALHNKPLFTEKVCKWEQGPVVPEVYDAFREFGGGAIPKPEFNPDSIPAQAQATLREVHTAFGQFSAWRLHEMARSEPPWRLTTKYQPIRNFALKAHFDTIVKR